MKKIAILLIILLATSTTFAQNTKRTSAFNHLRHGKLDKAKDAIDAAAAHKKTINDAKTWYYRGNIYLEIAMTDNEKYKDLDPECIDKALESFLKARELDVKGKLLIDILPRIMACGEQYYNKAVRFYNSKEYNKSSLNFFNAFEVNKNILESSVDTGALYNSALSAGLAENNDLAKIRYGMLVDLNYKNQGMYVTLSNYYKLDGDSIKALEYIQIGRERFPEDFQILITETNLFLNLGETEKALNNLKQALKTDSTNASIYSAVGSMYDRIVNDTSENLYDVTYTNLSGGTEQKSKVKNSWFEEFSAEKGTNVYLSNQVMKGKIAIASIYLDDVVFKTSKSEGEYVIASASGILPKSGNVKYSIKTEGSTISEVQNEAFIEAENAYKKAIYICETETSQNLYDVTYTNLSGGTEQKSKVKNSWFEEFSAEKGTNVYLSNQVMKGKIAIASIYLDDIVFKTSKSEGEYVIASASGILPKSGNVKYSIKVVKDNKVYFDAIYNLGALYFNRGVNNIQAADVLPYGDENYDTLKNLGDDYMKKSLPILEKAYELDPDDYSTLFSLKQIYSRVGNVDKYKEVSERLQNL